MAISNKQKRQLTCQFCPNKDKSGCRCDKRWKKVYQDHRNEILEEYRRLNPKQPQAAQKNSDLNEF